MGKNDEYEMLLIVAHPNWGEQHPEFYYGMRLADVLKKLKIELIGDLPNDRLQERDVLVWKDAPNCPIVSINDSTYGEMCGGSPVRNLQEVLADKKEFEAFRRKFYREHASS